MNMVGADDVRWCPVKPFCMRRIHEYLQLSFTAHRLTNGGPLQEVLSHKLRILTGSTRSIIPACSGTAALHGLVVAWEMRLGKNLRWATQAFSFPSSYQGPLKDSLIFDIDEQLGGPAEADLCEKKSLFDGLVITNVTGLLADVSFYSNWCRKEKKILIFDNAAVVVGQVDTCCIHDYGDGATVSLHETKPTGRGEGGAIFAPHDLSSYVMCALNFGFDPQLRIPHPSCSNWKMSDVAAAFILDHLDHVLDELWVSKYKQKTEEFVEVLSEYGLTLYQPPSFPAIPASVRLSLPQGHDAARVCDALNASNPVIEAKQYYRPLELEEKAPRSWQIYNTTVCLPFHLQLTHTQLKYMACMIANLCVQGN